MFHSLCFLELSNYRRWAGAHQAAAHLKNSVAQLKCARAADAAAHSLLTINIIPILYVIINIISNSYILLDS